MVPGRMGSARGFVFPAQLLLAALYAMATGSAPPEDAGATAVAGHYMAAA